MSYAFNMLQADAAERCKQWDIAANLYSQALTLLLYKAMFPVWNPQVRHVMERRAHCYRQSRCGLV